MKATAFGAFLEYFLRIKQVKRSRIGTNVAGSLFCFVHYVQVPRAYVLLLAFLARDLEAKPKDSERRANWAFRTWPDFVPIDMFGILRRAHMWSNLYTISVLMGTLHSDLHGRG